MDVLRIAGLIRRETILLVLLGGLAVVSFFGTRAAAEANRRMHRADAARWYAIGQERLDARHPEQAIAALRRATELNREDRTYRLTLASALEASGDVESARAVLIRLRTAAPEDARVNVQLARLDAASNPDDAARFYHAGLEALWEPEHDAERRRLRVEIIEFLLARGWTGRALSEVLALASDMPDTAAAHTEAGQLFLRAGDSARALRQFRAALQTDPDLTPARLGAARAAFDLADYRVSRDYLRRVPADEAGSPELRELVDRILTLDPLVRGLSSRERQRRLIEALDEVAARAAQCGATICGEGQPGCAELEALTSGARPLEKRLHVPGRHRSYDTVTADFSAIADLSARTSAACGIGSPTARALTLIMRQHQLDQP